MAKRRIAENRSHWIFRYDKAKAQHLSSEEYASLTDIPRPPTSIEDISYERLKHATESLLQKQKSLKGSKAAGNLQKFIQLQNPADVDSFLEKALSMLRNAEAHAFIHYYKLQASIQSEEDNDSKISPPSLEDFSQAILHYCDNLLWLVRTNYNGYFR